MTFVTDLFTWEELLNETSGGYVRLRYHADDRGLILASVTEKARSEGRENGVTLNCDDLIFRGTGEIITTPVKGWRA